MTGSIITMGVAPGSQDDPNNVLRDFVLSAAGRPHPKVCFLGTASGDAFGELGRFYRAFDGVAQTTHLGLFRREETDIEAFLLDQDVIYVGGGNTASMLGVWRAHGVGVILRLAHQRGILMCGESAGAMCWFESGVTAAFGPTPSVLQDGLGLLAGSCCPHYDLRQALYHELVQAERLPPGVGLAGPVGLRWHGGQVADAVGSGAAHSVRRGDGKVVSAKLTSPIRSQFAGAAHV